MRRWVRRWLGRWWLLACAALSAAPLAAHEMPRSVVQVSVLPQAWQLDLQLPAERLAVAMAHAAGRAPVDGTLPPPSAYAVQAYLLERVTADDGAGGPPWQVQQVAITPPRPVTTAQTRTDEVAASAEPLWQVRLHLLPPPGRTADVPSLTLHYEVILREIATHTAVVSIAQDWSRGVLPQQPVLAGALRNDVRQIALQRGDAQPWTAASRMFVLGLHHIAEGADHLLFLAVLLLTAASVCVNGRWQPVARGRTVLAQAGWRITAFTLGHGASLAGAAMGWLPPAGTGVELLVAASVGLTALHAMRPLFPRREGWLVAAFGVVHGLAFAEALVALQLPRGVLLAATLAFNLGVEAMQLLVAAVVLPPLLLWRAHRWQPAARVAVASAALLAAIGWGWQRAMV